MTKSFVTIFVIIMMAMAVTLIRAHPAHSFAIWLVTCTQEEKIEAAPDWSEPAILTNVDPEVTVMGPCSTEDANGIPTLNTCAECLNALVNGSKKGVVPGLLEGIKVTYTQLAGGGSLIQVLVGL